MIEMFTVVIILILISGIQRNWINIQTVSLVYKQRRHVHVSLELSTGKGVLINSPYYKVLKGTFEAKAVSSIMEVREREVKRSWDRKEIHAIMPSLSITTITCSNKALPFGPYSEKFYLIINR